MPNSFIASFITTVLYVRICMYACMCTCVVVVVQTIAKKLLCSGSGNNSHATINMQTDWQQRDNKQQCLLLLLLLFSTDDVAEKKSHRRNHSASQYNVYATRKCSIKFRQQLMIFQQDFFIWGAFLLLSLLMLLLLVVQQVHMYIHMFCQLLIATCEADFSHSLPHTNLWWHVASL